MNITREGKEKDKGKKDGRTKDPLSVLVRREFCKSAVCFRLSIVS